MQWRRCWNEASFFKLSCLLSSAQIGESLSMLSLCSWKSFATNLPLATFSEPTHLRGIKLWLLWPTFIQIMCCSFIQFLKFGFTLVKFLKFFIGCNKHFALRELLVILNFLPVSNFFCRVSKYQQLVFFLSILVLVCCSYPIDCETNQT